MTWRVSPSILGQPGLTRICEPWRNKQSRNSWQMSDTSGKEHIKLHKFPAHHWLKKHEISEACSRSTTQTLEVATLIHALLPCATPFLEAAHTTKRCVHNNWNHPKCKAQVVSSLRLKHNHPGCKQNFGQCPPRPYHILSPWKTHIFWTKTLKTRLPEFMSSCHVSAAPCEGPHTPLTTFCPCPVRCSVALAWEDL